MAAWLPLCGSEQPTGYEIAGRCEASVRRHTGHCCTPHPVYPVHCHVNSVQTAKKSHRVPMVRVTGLRSASWWLLWLTLQLLTSQVRPQHQLNDGISHDLPIDSLNALVNVQSNVWARRETSSASLTGALLMDQLLLEVGTSWPQLLVQGATLSELVSAKVYAFSGTFRELGG